MNEIMFVCLCAFFVAMICGFVFVHLEFLRVIKQNSQFLAAADGRLAQANNMVLELSQSVHELSSSLQGFESMMAHMETEYSTHIDQVCANRDEIMESYKKLLFKYEQMQDDSFRTLKELARRPSVTTNNNLDDSGSHVARS